MKRTDPNLKDWADALIHGITGDDSYNPKLVKWVQAELEDIADKYYQMGSESIEYPVNIEEEQVRKDFPKLTRTDWFRISNYLKQAYEKGFRDGDKDGWWKAQEERIAKITSKTPYTCVHGRDWRSVYSCVECGEKENLSQLGTQDRKIEGKMWRNHFDE